MSTSLPISVEDRDLGYPALAAGVIAVLARVLGLDPFHIVLLDRELGAAASPHVCHSKTTSRQVALTLDLAHFIPHAELAGESLAKLDPEGQLSPTLTDIVEAAVSCFEELYLVPPTRAEVLGALRLGGLLVGLHRSAVDDLARHLVTGDLDETEVPNVLDCHGVEELPVVKLAALGLAPYAVLPPAAWEQDDHDQC